MLTLTMFSVLTRCLGFLYKIYLSRIMTTTDLGIYNQTLSLYMVLITIISSSIPLTISKITSLNKSNNKGYLTNYSITSSLIFNTILSICLSISVLALKGVIIQILGSTLAYDILISLIPSIVFTALYAQIRGYLWGLENYFAVSIVEFIEQILRIAFCMIFVTLDIFPSPVISVGVALSIACGLSTIYGYILYFKNGGRLRFKRGFIGPIIQSSAPLTCVRILGSLLQPIVAIILPIQLTKIGMEKSIALSELGVIMGMSLPLLSIPSTIIGALCMVLIPRIGGQEKDNMVINKQIDSYINFSLICLFMFLPIFMVLGTPMCTFVFDNASAGMYLSYASWVILPMGIAQITTSILNALNQEQKSFVYFLISSIFMILVVIVCPQFLGTKSMVLGMGLSNLVLAILNLRKIHKLTDYQSHIISKLTRLLCINLPIILLTKLCYNLLISNTNTFISLMLCGIICTVSYLSLLFVFNILNFKNIKYTFKKYTKKSQTKSV